MNPALMPAGMFGLTQGGMTPQQAPAEPFVYGKGGKRMTPEEVALQKKLGLGMLQTGMDFSPVGHWTQGLARASQGILGGMQMADSRKASEANAEETDAVVQALLAGGQPGQDPAEGNAAIMAALANPYISDQARGIAEMQFKAMQPKQVAPTDVEKLMLASGIQRGSPEWNAQISAELENRRDPFTTFQGPAMGYTGRQSGLVAALGGGGQVSGAAPGGTPAAPPPEAIQALQRGEGTPEQFDEMFGPGSAARFTQGGPARAPGNFRP